MRECLTDHTECKCDCVAAQAAFMLFVVISLQDINPEGERRNTQRQAGELGRLCLVQLMDTGDNVWL